MQLYLLSLIHIWEVMISIQYYLIIIILNMTMEYINFARIDEMGVVSRE